MPVKLPVLRNYPAVMSVYDYIGGTEPRTPPTLVRFLGRLSGDTLEDIVEDGTRLAFTFQRGGLADGAELWAAAAGLALSVLDRREEA